MPKTVFDNGSFGTRTRTASRIPLRAPQMAQGALKSSGRTLPTKADISRQASILGKLGGRNYLDGRLSKNKIENKTKLSTPGYGRSIYTIYQ